MKLTHKHTSTAVIGLTFLFAGHANADTLLGGYIGAQSWQMSADGGFSQNENLVDFEFEDENQVNFYAALEHPIPLVPNIKIARTTMDTSGTTTLTGSFEFGGEVYIADSDLTTQIELTATDYTLYYEILDNDVVSIDIGITGKQIDGDIMVQSDDGDASQENISAIIPMGYAKVAIGLPLTGLGIYAEGAALAIDDDSFTDYQIALTYSFVESLALDLTLQAGYRSTELDINDVDDVYADLQFDGVFLGLEFDF